MHSVIGEVNEDFQFWTNIPNGEPHSDNTYNTTVPNQANNNMPTNGESKSNILLSSLEVLVANKYGVICDRSDDDVPSPLPPESLDDNVWNLERYWFNDDNNNFNYDDIDKEILQFKYEDSIKEFETIDFHDCDDVLDATQGEEGNTE